jgi:hypothetical protein
METLSGLSNTNISFSSHDTFLNGAPNRSFLTVFNVTAVEHLSGETKVAATITLSIVDCGPFTCQNNGSCIDIGTPNDMKYTCMCQFKFAGDHCQTFDDIAPTISKCPAHVLKLIDFNESEGKVSIAQDLKGTYSVFDNLNGSTLSTSFSNFDSDAQTFPQGRHSITFKVVDAAANSAECSFSVTVIRMASIDNRVRGFQGQLLEYRLLDLMNLTLLYQLDVPDGHLPDGLVLSSQAGSLVGIPSIRARGVSHVIIRACDAEIGDKPKTSPWCMNFTVEIEIVAFSVQVSVDGLFNIDVDPSRRGAHQRYRYPLATKNLFYITPTLTVTSVVGGSGCIKFRVAKGYSLPLGLIMETDGAIRGTPLQSFNSTQFGIEAYDANNVQVNVNSDADFSISVKDCDDSFNCKNGECVDTNPFDALYGCDCSGSSMYTNNPQDNNSCTLLAKGITLSSATISSVLSPSELGGAIGGGASLLIIIIAVILFVLYKVSPLPRL